MVFLTPFTSGKKFLKKTLIGEKVQFLINVFTENGCSDKKRKSQMFTALLVQKKSINHPKEKEKIDTSKSDELKELNYH